MLKIEKYNPKCHKVLLNDYLKNVENNFKFIPFIFSLDFINILFQFKNLFIILKNEKVINLFYKNDIKNHVGFLFEKPKKDYDVLNSADSVVSIFITKESTKNPLIKEFEELIIDNKKIFETQEINLKNVNKKIRKIKKDYPNIIYEDFDFKKDSKEEIEAFYNEWKNMFGKNKYPYMFLYEKYLKFIYDNKNNINGIIAKDKNKIIGLSLFLMSPLKKQAIGLTCNGLYSYKGLNEILAYLRYEKLWKDKICFTNVGPCAEGEVVDNKMKFGAFKEKYYMEISKGKELRKPGFWYNDCFDPDDWEWN